MQTETVAAMKLNSVAATFIPIGTHASDLAIRTVS
jgi:hypothetical protein